MRYIPTVSPGRCPYRNRGLTRRPGTATNANARRTHIPISSSAFALSFSNANRLCIQVCSAMKELLKIEHILWAYQYSCDKCSCSYSPLFFFFLFLSLIAYIQLTPQQQSAEPRNSDSAEALASSPSLCGSVRRSMERLTGFGAKAGHERNHKRSKFNGTT